MAQVNFYLKDKRRKDETLIYLFYSFDGQRLKYSTGQAVKPSLWNFKAMRVKKSATDSSRLNSELDKLEANVKTIYSKANINEEYLSSQLLRDKLDALKKG